MAGHDANKEKYEYVSLIDPDLVAVDVRQVGDVLSKCAVGTKEALDAYTQKHRLISKAKEVANNLDNDIKRFEKYAKWKLFERVVKKEVKEKVVEKEKKPMSEDDYYLYSKRALANLKDNIEEMKRQLSRL
jgi:hypothetical protein